MDKQPRKTYQTDLNDKPWELLEPLLPQKRGTRGRPRIWPMREILNAIFYVVRSGCA
jgi:putative transposase